MDQPAQPNRRAAFIKSLLTIRPAYNLFSRDYWFGQIDTRPISVFRIVLALLLLKDAIYTFPLVEILYSDHGIVPISAIRMLGRSARFSLLDAMPQPWMVDIYLVVWCAVLILLMVGYRTRLMAILNAILIVSMHERNVYVLNGADTVFRVLSLWSIFLPLGHYYSIDALRQRFARFRASRYSGDLRAPSAPRTGFAFPVRIVQLQIAILYLFTGLLKVPGGPSAWINGEALNYALQLKSLTLPTGDWLLQAAPPWLLSFIGYQTLFTEILFIVMVFAPIGQPVLRMLALALGVMLHGGIAVTMSIGNFSMVMVGSYILFFEAGWITWIGEKLRAAGRSVLAMGAPLPNSPLWLLLAATRADEIMIDGDSQSDTSFDDWTVRDGRAEYMRADAWRRTLAHFPLSRLWVWAVHLSFVRRVAWAFFSLVSTRLYLPAPDALAAPYNPPNSGRAGRWARVAGTALVTLVLAALMTVVIRWNLASAVVMETRLGPAVSDAESNLILYSGLWQYWAMFAPYPSTNDGWVIVQGKFEDGREMDLRTGEPVTAVPYRVFWGPDIRWKKYESNLFDSRNEALLKAWADHYCLEYNVNENLPQGSRLATILIIYRGRLSHVPGQPINPDQDWILWKHWCFEEYKF